MPHHFVGCGSFLLMVFINGEHIYMCVCVCVEQHRYEPYDGGGGPPCVPDRWTNAQGETNGL